jgi:hypothetical protein
MDIRNTEEFKEKQRQRLRELAEQELGVTNVLTVLHRTNSLKEEVFKENKVGEQGIMNLLILASIGISTITYGERYAKWLPRFNKLFGKSTMSRLIFIYMSMSLGRSIELYRIEHKLAKEAYQEYKQSADYYEVLKTRKLATLDIEKRLSLLFHTNISSYLTGMKKEETPTNTI